MPTDAPTFPSTVEWSAAVIAEVVGVDADPVATRSATRTALHGRTQLTAEERALVLERVLTSLRLAPARAEDPVRSLETVELPLVTLSGGGAALTARAGRRIELRQPGHGSVWLTVDEARDFVASREGPWLTAAPASPLEALAHATPLGRLGAWLHLERDDLWVVAIYAAAVGLLTLAVPIAVQALVSSVAFASVLQPIVVLSLLLLAALGGQATLKALQLRVVEAIQQRVFARVALDLAWRLPRLAPGASPAGIANANRFFEALTLQKTMSVLLTDGVATVLQIVIGLLVLAFYHPWLLAFDALLVGVVAVVLVAPASRGLSTSVDESHAKYDVAQWLQELARARSAFQGTSGFRLAAERADALTRRYLAARRAHFRVVFGQTVGVFALQVVASASLLGLGGVLVLRGELTLGQLVAAELIVAAITTSMAKAGKLLDTTYDLLTSLDKVGHVLELPVIDDARGEPLPGRGPLRVEAKALATGRGTLSFEVTAGERVAVVDQPGATAQWLGGRARSPDAALVLNGVDAVRTQATVLREDVAIVEAGGVFEGTLEENVTAGRDHLTSADVRAALDRVGLLEDVRALPRGLDQPIDANAAPLDPHQALRLLVARAIAGRPRLLVVDAPIEALRQEDRVKVIDALCRDDAPWTLVSIVPEATAALARRSHRVLEATS